MTVNFKRDAALQYARAGLKVFQLHNKIGVGCSCGNSACKSQGKHPLLSNWQQLASSSEADINRWWNDRPNANLGLLTGSVNNLFVVDIDTYKDPQAKAWWDNYVLENSIAETVISETARGGLHYFFDTPNGEKVFNGTDVLCKGIDIRGDGGFVAAWPSDGYHYKNDCPIMDNMLDSAPDNLLHIVCKRGAGQLADTHYESTVNTILLSDAEVSKILHSLEFVSPDSYQDWWKIGAALHASGDKRAFQWWDQWSQTTSEGNYNYPALVEAWVTLDSRIGEDIQININYLFSEATKNGWVEKIDTSNCDFTLGAAELKMALKKQGEDVTRQTVELMAVEAKSDVPNCVAATSKLIVHNMLTLGQFNEAMPTEDWWYDGGLFQGSTLLVSGQPKVGKSKLFMIMAGQAAIGGSFLGQPFSRPLRTLWLQAEIHHSKLGERISDMYKWIPEDKRDLFNSNFLFTPKFSIDIMKSLDLEEIKNIIRTLDIDLIAVDPVVNASTINENDNREVFALLSKLCECKTARCPKNRQELTSVAIMHHMKKNADPDFPFEAIRGASAFQGFYDTGIALITEQKTKTLKCYMEFRNRPSDVPPQYMFFENGNVRLTETPIDLDADGGLCDDATEHLKNEYGLGTYRQAELYMYLLSFVGQHGRTDVGAIAESVSATAYMGYQVKEQFIQAVKGVCKLAEKHGGAIIYRAEAGSYWIMKK